MIKAWSLLLFYLTNQLFVPYRFKNIEPRYSKLREKIAKKLFNFVGEDVVIRPHVKISYMENLELGDRSSIGDRSVVVAAGGVMIGADVMMGPEVMIYSQNHEITPQNVKLIDGQAINKKVTIEEDVWIGARAIILPGAKIARGSVVAAGAVVPGKEFPPNAVIGGNPAKVIKFRG